MEPISLLRNCGRPKRRTARFAILGQTLKFGRPLALLLGALMAGQAAQAGPIGGRVVSGEADIMQSSPNRLDIVQQSDKAIIDWRSFSIDADEHTDFQQPSSSSIALNRVRGDEHSHILGQLTANGRVMLINPNGVLFGETARVDVGGLVATTHDISNEDFKAGRFSFNAGGNPGGTVVNRGRITAAQGGLVALVAPGVENSGVIHARLGHVALASGNSFTLDFHGDSLIQLAVDDRVAERLLAPDGAELKALVGNRGTIGADGGTVVLLAVGVAKNVVDYAINMEGIVEARSAVERNGQIVLQGTGEGVVRVAGTLDASGRGSGETGGGVKVLGEKVGMVGKAAVDASGDAGGGEILIGGNFQGQGPERNADHTVVGKDAVIRADAGTSGDGGRVIVWSDRVTRFSGTLSARGGDDSGDGGFVEVSGLQHLQFDPTAIDLGAPNGVIGKLLLDPRDITISDANGDDNSQLSGTDPTDYVVNFGDGTATEDFSIQPSAFEAIDADITLQASRDITVSSPIDRSGAANSTLYLQAGRHLKINANITGTNGKHSFIFEADSPRSTSGAADGTGTLTIGNSVTITSNGGSITLIGMSFIISTTTGSEASINAGAGDIHIAPSRTNVALGIVSSGVLTSTELQRLMTTGTIVLGTATTGPTSTNTAGSSISASNITVSQALTFAGSASVKFDATGRTRLSANVSTGGGAITFSDTVFLGAAVTVSSGSGAGNILFSSTVDGSRALTVTAGTGSVTFSGAVGAAAQAALTSLAVTGSGGISLGGNVKTTGNIDFNSAVTLSAAAAVSTGAGAGNVAFDSTVNGGYALTVTAGSGSVTFSGVVGGTTALTSLAVTGSGGISLGGNVTTTGNIDFNSAVSLSAAAAVSTGTGAGNVAFDSTVNGGYALSVTAGTGSVTFSGAVGGTTALTSLTVNGGQIDLDTVATTGAISVTGTNIDLNGATYDSDDGNVTFTGPVDLHANVTVESDKDTDNDDGDITFTGAINAASTDQQRQWLTLYAHTGAVNLQGAVGGTIKPANLTIDGGQIDLGAIAVVGGISIQGRTNIDLNGATYTSDDANILFDGAVDLHANVSVDSDANNTSTAGNIEFTSTIDSSGSARTLTLDANTGAADLQGAVGGTTALSSLTVDGGQIDLNTVATAGVIDIEGTNIDLNGASYKSADGNIKFTGPVDLHIGVTMDSDSDDDDTDGTITFTSTVNANTAGTESLTLDAGGGAVNLQGAVGGTRKLSSLTVSGGQIDLSTVAVAGALSVTGTGIDLNGATYWSDDGAITFTGPVDLTVNVSVDSDKNTDTTDGAITFTSTIDGAHSLTLDADTGAVDLQGAVGGTTALTNLTITSANVTLAAVTLSGTLTLTSSGTITLKGNISVDDTAISFGRPVVLGANVTIDTDADNDGTDGSITFTSTINGGYALTLDADTAAVNLQGAVGGTTALTSLTVTGGQIDLNTVATSGVISVTGTNIDLNAGSYTTQGGNITFTGPVDLDHSAAVTVSSGTGAGNISFSSTINGARALTVTGGTGSVNLGGAVGGTTKLASLSVSGGQIDLSTVATTGVISVTGTNIDLNGETYNSDDGNITFTGPVDLHGSVSVDSDKDDDTNDGNITFTSTVDGAAQTSWALTLDADSGAVNLQGATGGTERLNSLTVDGGQIDLNSVATLVSIDIEGTDIDLNGATYTSSVGNITFTGPVDLHANVSADSADGGVGFGDITFTSTVNGAYSLTLNTANDRTVNLQGAVGSTTKLTSLTVTAGSQVDLNTVATTGAISVTGMNIDLNGATYWSDDGNITFTGAVDLHANVSVDSDKDEDNTDGDITFTSTVDANTAGTESLTLDAHTGGVDLQGAVGGTNKLNNLTITAADISLAAVTLGGTLTLTSTGTITLKGNISVDDTAVSFSRPVVLGANVTIDTDADGDGTDGSITFASTSTINGGYALVLDADTAAVNLQGAVGGTTALTSLTVTGGQIDLNTVATTGAISVTGTNIDLNGATYNSNNGNITFTGPVDLHANVSVDSDANNDGTDGDITFPSTIDAATAGTQSLTLDASTGAVDLQGAVGGTTKLASLTVSGGQIDLSTVAVAGVISVTGTNIDLNGATYESDDGNITFTGAVDLHADVTVDSDADTDTTDGGITFTSTVDDDGTHLGRQLTLDAGTGAVNLQGAVGGTTKPNFLTVSGGQIDLAAVATTNGISVEGTNIDLNGATYSSEGSHITFTGPVDLHANVTVDSDSTDTDTGGNITFTSTINGAYSLTLDAGTTDLGGTVNLQGAVGGTAKLTSLTVAGGQIDLAAVATSGAIAVTGDNIDLNGATYNSDDGDITFTGPVDLHANVSIDSDKDTDDTDGDITFTSTIDAATAGTQSLTLDAHTGDVDLQGAVGGTRKLNNLSITANDITLAAVTLGGTLTLTSTNGTITLKGDILVDDTAVSFGRPVVLAANVRIDTDADNDGVDGSITFTSTINGGYALTLDADTGAVNLGGAVGGSTRLTSLTIDGGQIDLNTVATTGAISVEGSNIDLNAASYNSQGGNITFTGSVDLDHSAAVTVSSGSGGGNISFSSTINGARALTVTGGTGSVNLGGAVGGTTKPASLTVNGGQIDLNTVAVAGVLSVTGTNIDLNGATYWSDDGNITFTGPVDLTVNVSVDSDKDGDTTDGDITFTGTINGGQTLALDADDGAVNLQGAVGGTTKLASLTVSGAQIDLNTVATVGAISVTGTNIDLNGATYWSDDGNITFTGPVDLHANVSVDSDKDGDTTDGDITFTSTIDAATAGTQSLTLDADTGAVNLGGAVGGTNKLASLTVTGGQIDLNTVAVAGDITITGTNTDLNGATYYSDEGDISFGGTVDLHTNVTVDADADNDAMDGAIFFFNTVDAATAGTQSLTLDAGEGNVFVQGAIGGTTKLASLTVNGSQITLNTVAVAGDITITGTTIILGGATYYSDDGDITFTGPVVLRTNVTVDSDADDDTTDGDITFTSTVNAESLGQQSLTLDADTGDVDLQGAVGGTAKPANLTVDGGQIDLNSVAVNDAIDIDGMNIDLNGASYTSNDGNIDFRAAVDLHADVMVNSDDDTDNTDGNIRFHSTVNGGQTLTVTAGTGSVTFSGAVGGTTKLTSLTVTGGQVDLDTVATVGAISVTGTNINLNGATYNSDNGDITFTGPVDLHANVTVDSDANNDTTDGDITFTSTIDAATAGTQSLTLDASGGAVTLQGAVGGTNKLASLTVTGGAVSLKDVKVVGAISVTGSTSITLDGDYFSDDGDITFTGVVTLSGAVSVDSDADDDGTDGDITFTSTINGGQTLTLDASTGAVDLQGAAGGITRLTSLTINGGQIDLNTVATTGAISVTGTDIDLNAGSYSTQNSNITFAGPVDLDHSAAVTVSSDTGGGNISFSSTINGAQALTVTGGTGSVNLGGAVGGTTKLASLTVSGGQIDLNTVATTGAISVTGTNIDLNGATYNSDNGNITFTGPVDLHANVTVDSDANNDTTNGNITFTSTINAATAGTQSLTLDASGGAVTLQGAVGGTNKLASLTVTGGVVSLKSVRTAGAISVTGTTSITLDGNYFSDDGNITFTGAVTLSSAVSVDSDADNDNTDGSITFTSTINGAQTLVLDADGGAVDLQGAVGGTTALTSLTINGGQIDLNTVATTGAISVTGSNIDLNAGSYSTQGGNITFTGPVDLDHTATVTVSSGSGGGNISFSSTINGARALTVTGGTGSVTLSGAVGGTTALTSLTVTGGAVSLKDVRTVGAISVTGTTSITLDGDYFSDDGNITFTGAVTLSGAVSVDSDADNDSTDGTITFTSTINGGQNLTLDASTGAVNLQGAVGGTTALASLTINGNQIDLNTVATTGAISVTGSNIDLNAGSYTTQASNIAFTGPVDLHANVTVSSDTGGGNISFSSTINGAQALTVTGGTGSVNLQGAVGGTTKLASLTVSGGQVDLSTVATTGTLSVTGSNIDLNGATYTSDDGTVTFTGPVDLHANVTVDSDQDNDTTDGNITFTSTVDAATAGAQSLTLDSDGGNVELRGAVGATRKLASLTINGNQIDLSTVATTGAISVTGSNIDLNGATYRSDDGNITFTGPVDLHTNVTVDSDADDDTADGNITFTSTVDGNYDLTLDADTGSVTLSAAAGGTTPLKSLNVNGGTVSLSGVSTTGNFALSAREIVLKGNYGSTNGNITFTGSVALSGAVTVNSDTDGDGTGGNIVFSSTVDGRYALVLNAGTGAVNLQGAVGGTTPVTSLTVDGGQIDLDAVATAGAIDVEGTNIDLNGATYRSNDGNITFTGPVDLHNSVTMDSDADGDGTTGNIAFTSTVDGRHALVLDAGTGSVMLSAEVGGTTPLASLAVTGETSLSANVTTTGEIDFNSAVTLLGNGALTVSSGPEVGNISFDGTVDGERALVLDAGTGSVMLNGAVGGTTPLTSLAVTGSGGISLGANVTTTGAIDFNNAVTLLGTGALTVSNGTGPGNISFDGTVDGGRALTVMAGTGSVMLSGAVGGTTPLTSLTVDGGQIDLNAVATTDAIDIEGTNINLNGATYRSNDGDIDFRGPVDLAVNVSVDSDADDDGTNGNIRFYSTVDGGQALALDAGSGNIDFDDDAGATDKLGAVTVASASNVTVGTSINAVSFTQTSGTGTTDFGSNTLYADTFVDVTTRDIYGRIIAKDVKLKAANFIGATVQTGTLRIEAKNAEIEGTVGGLEGQAAADKTLIDNRGPGSYKLNGFTILGTGAGTRTYAELSALPPPGPRRHAATPAGAVFSSFIPILRASITDAIGGPYALNIYEMPFLLLLSQPGTESYYNGLPDVIRDFPWRRKKP